MSLEEALAGKDIPDDIKNSVTLVAVPFVSFSGEVCEGQLVVHKEVADEVREIFKKLSDMRFPIERMVPVVAYQWDDDASMAANNSSAFNYRIIYGTDRLSNHAYGRAIDINPIQNPYVRSDGTAVPSGARYDLAQPGTVTDEVVGIFKSHGWTWGGEWSDRKDWQHFEKPK